VSVIGRGSTAMPVKPPASSTRLQFARRREPEDAGAAGSGGGSGTKSPRTPVIVVKNGFLAGRSQTAVAKRAPA